jgi:trimeric autotransporter adhesin
MIMTGHGSRLVRALRVALMALLAAWSCGGAEAQVPDEINYQGRLTSPGGQPVNATVSMVFSLYDVATGGSALYSETQSVTVANGTFNVAIGSVTPLALPFDVPYYLGITVGADPEMTPRQALLATPYALGAANAGGASFNGNITLAESTSASVGNIYKGTKPFIHNYGSGDTFVGEISGNFTMTGADNTGFGYGTLLTNSTGGSNTAVGVEALVANTSGSANTAIGDAAAIFNTSGSFNTATGYTALYNNGSGNNNTAIGDAAAFFNTSGSFNTATGYTALYNNDSGNFNTANGEGTLFTNVTGALNTAVGDTALYANISGDENAAVGFLALGRNTIGDGNSAFGAGALFSNFVGSSNTAVGADADVVSIDLTNATAIGAGAHVDASNRVRIGDSQVTQIGGQVAWSNLSDRREKKDIRDLTFGLDFIKALHPVEFRLRNSNDRIDFGFIAQDVEALIGTQYNVLGIGGTAERKLSLRYTDLIAPMVKAIQQQQALIEAQASEIAMLRQQVAQMAQLQDQTARLAALEARLGVK